MSDSRMLKKDLVRRPELWNMALKFEQSALHVLLHSPLEENALIYREIALDPDASTPMRAIEDAVYDNPLLLSDFKTITCVTDTRRVMAIPAGIESIDDREMLLDKVYPDGDGEIVENDLMARNASLIFSIDTELSSFIARTFFNARILHQLTPLCRHFMAESRRANTRRMYANLRHGSVDLIAYDHCKLLMANTLELRDSFDAVYYILASFEALGLDRMADELLISGDAALREEITPPLRDYISYVMPVIFPSAMFKAGKEAMKAPFELVTLQSCE